MNAAPQQTTQVKGMADATALLAAVERVQNLTDEIKQLHPMLRELFPKLAGIKHVDYTHGQQEMGADFVLHKFDETLQRMQCIGVIVKSKAIQQNHDDVNRQIEECRIPRLSADGGQTIVFSEIWIVSSQGITGNAKTKIYNKYTGTNIVFIPGQRLAEMVDKHLPPEFSRIPPILQDYAANRLAEIETENQRSILGLADFNFYIEPELTRVEYDGYGQRKLRKKLRVTIDSLLNDCEKLPCLMIEAPMGGGKSKLGREIVRRLLSGEGFADGKVFPYSLHARVFASDFASDVGQLVAHIRQKYSLLDVCKPVIVIDGFDELDISNEERGSVISGALSYCGPKDGKPTLVFLTRPLDETGQLTASLKSLDIYRIGQLKGTRGLQLMARAAGNVKISTKIMEDVKESRLFVALDGAPIAYLLLGRLLNENQQDLPSNLTELFQKYCELVLGRWEIAKGLRSQIEYEVLTEVLTTLSEFFMENNLGEISIEYLRQLLNDYVKPRGLPVSVDHLLAQITSRQGILFLKKESQMVGFRHRAFAEFFYAKRMYKTSSIDISLKVLDPYWTNSYFFAVGLLRDCPDLLTKIVDLDLMTESDRIGLSISMGQFLLAGYLTPKFASRYALKKVFQDIAQLYIDALTPGSELKLTTFPPLQLLGVLNLIMRTQYGYKHFKDDLGDCIYDIEDGPNTPLTAITLLFLDTAYRSAGGELRFDSLLEKFGDSLPLPVKLGIKHESSRMKELSTRVLRMERNLRRSFNSPKVDSKRFLNRLYNVPIMKLDKPVAL